MNEDNVFEDDDDDDGIVVTEKFIGNVLYYVDDSENWYDSAYNPIEKPITSE